MLLLVFFLLVWPLSCHHGRRIMEILQRTRTYLRNLRALLLPLLLVVQLKIASLFCYHLPFWDYKYFLFMFTRWENCTSGGNTVIVWRFDVHLCFPMDSCFKSKRWGDTPWFHFCDFHVGFNVRKLLRFSAYGSLFTQSRELHADCFCNLCCLSPPSHFGKCMPYLFDHLYFIMHSKPSYIHL